jgi:hypothetical protein
VYYYISSCFLHKVQDNDYGNGTHSIKKKEEEKREIGKREEGRNIEMEH